jgi:hypothetical protein
MKNSVALALALVVLTSLLAADGRRKEGAHMNDFSKGLWSLAYSWISKRTLKQRSPSRSLKPSPMIRQRNQC